MLSMSRRDNGARWFTGNSLKFRVGGVFINGKMTVSLPHSAAPTFQVLTKLKNLFYGTMLLSSARQHQIADPRFTDVTLSRTA